MLAEKQEKQIQELRSSQNALCRQHLFGARRQSDEFRNNDPLQPVIKQLGFTWSVPLLQAELLESTYLLTYVAHTLTR